MKVIGILLLAACLCPALPARPQTQSQTDQRLQAIAHKIVTVSAAVKPGEVVVISGSIGKLPLLEQLAIEAAKAGAIVEPLYITTDRLQRALLTDVPEEYLGQPDPTFDSFKTVDVSIRTDNLDDAKAVLEGVPETKLSKAARSEESYRNAVGAFKMRQVFVDVPNRRIAEYSRMDWTTYENMQWDAINADYSEIMRKGDQLAKLLETAKIIKISSPSGTDISLTVGNHKAFVNAGILGERATASGSTFVDRQIALPGGRVIVASLENSANGKVIAPKDTCRPYEYLTGANYVFENGKMTSFSATGNADCFQQGYAAYSGDRDKFAYLQIGLNPALKVMDEDSEYRPNTAAGMVTLGLGNNQLLGGNNKTEFFWEIPVVKATVEVDGKPVIKDGQLVF